MDIIQEQRLIDKVSMTTESLDQLALVDHVITYGRPLWMIWERQEYVKDCEFARPKLLEGSYEYQTDLNRNTIRADHCRRSQIFSHETWRVELGT